MIVISELSHRVAGKPILSDISVTIPSGGITALIGPNGAGKSTLLSLISRLEKIQSGTITVQGLNVAQCDSRTVAQTLAILPQAEETAPRLMVKELVAFARYPYNRGHLTPQDREIVAQSLALFDLNELADRQLDSLSGGQRQRAKVAMAYAQDTQYLLLDEPLNNLDLAASRSLMKLLRQLAQEAGKTVVIVLHDINYASAYADWIVTLKDGRIKTMGRPEEVITTPMLADVFETDATVQLWDGRPFVSV